MFYCYWVFNVSAFKYIFKSGIDLYLNIIINFKIFKASFKKITVLYEQSLLKWHGLGIETILQNI
ncbi:hypothetical protein QTP88_018043 [Uroleucon formosanum]